MCTIFGWNTRQKPQDIEFLLDKASARGRDGWGVWADGWELRGQGAPSPELFTLLKRASKVVGNFRATPTTEIVSRVELLQPYQGVVHNGTIANDKSFPWPTEVDSQVLGHLFADVHSAIDFRDQLKRVVGSYATAFFRDGDLYLGTNYKPIYIASAGKNAAGVMFASQPYMLPRPSHPMPQYTVRRYEKNQFVELDLPVKQPKRALVSASAGLDSTTVAYLLKAEGYEVGLVHFNYGCVAEPRETARIRAIAEHGFFNLMLMDLPKSALGGTIVNGTFNRVGAGMFGAEYAHDWVSARNLLMLAMMTAMAETNGYGYIAFGGNLEESGAYPDNEEEFARRFDHLLPFATQNGTRIELLHPLTRYMKHEIVAQGLKVGVPYELTWSCYGGGETHCGECGPCFMRRKAFERNGKKDPAP